jgi:DNA-binding CsgD family transcriptional regulator
MGAPHPVHRVGLSHAGGRGSSRPLRRPRRCRRGPGGLTRRELEILRCVASGASNHEVARSLWVTDETVKFHLANVYRRLHVHSRADAASWAAARGLLDGSVVPRFELVELRDRVSRT